MATNTTYSPKTLHEFTKDHLEFSGQSIYLTCGSSDTQEADLALTDDYLITGGNLIVENGIIDDEVYLQVYHPTLGVVKEFVSGYRIASGTTRQLTLDLAYPAKITAGLSIRCKYVSGFGLFTRKIAVNLYLHRVLE